MKKIVKVASILFLTLFWISIFSHNVICDTIIKDTTVSVEIGDTLLYKVEDKFPYENTTISEIIGSKIRFTVENISHSVDVLYMTCTIENYFEASESWFVNYSNDYYMAANTTLQYLNFGSYLDDGPVFFVIPIPINLTTLGEYLLLRSDVSDYEIEGNTIYTSHLGSYHMTYNSDGILTKLDLFIFGIPLGTISLITTKDNGIPFGNFYLIFLIISAFTLVYIKWKKTK